MIKTQELVQNHSSRIYSLYKGKPGTQYLHQNKAKNANVPKGNVYHYSKCNAEVPAKSIQK